MHVHGDLHGRSKLNQNSACQELQIRQKKGPKMASEAISEHKIFAHSHTRPEQFNFASTRPVQVKSFVIVYIEFGQASYRWDQLTES